MKNNSTIKLNVLIDIIEFIFINKYIPTGYKYNSNLEKNLGNFIYRNKDWSPLKNFLNLYELSKTNKEALISYNKLILELKPKFGKSREERVLIDVLNIINKTGRLPNVRTHKSVYNQFIHLVRSNYIDAVEIYNKYKIEKPIKTKFKPKRDISIRYIEYFRKNGSHPSIHDKNSLSRNLAFWFNNLSKEERNTLIIKLEEKRIIKSQKEWIQELLMFVREHNRLPNQRGSKYEQSLYDWMIKRGNNLKIVKEIRNYYSVYYHQYRLFVRFCLLNNSYPKCHTESKNLWIWGYRHKDDIILKNFKNLFDLYKEGDPEAIKAINLLKEKLSI